MVEKEKKDKLKLIKGIFGFKQCSCMDNMFEEEKKDKKECCKKE